MDQIAATAASGLRSRMEALDILSNNLANANTGGYKVDREFYSLYQGEQTTAADGQQATTLPVIQKAWTDFQQGLLTPTGNPLDLALEGKGFFTVEGPSGPLYTRNGAFKLSTTGSADHDGRIPRSRRRARERSAEKDPDRFAGTDSNRGRRHGPTRWPETLGQIQLVDFANTSALDKMGNSYYRVTDPKMKGTPAKDATVTQGNVENSNVAPAESAVRLVDLMRQYEMLQKAVSVAADMNKEAIDQVARVGG